MTRDAVPASEVSQTDNRRRWAVAFAYLASIYATLGAVPVPLAYLRSHNMLRLTIGSLFAICFLIVLTTMYFRTRKPWRFMALIVLAGVYGWLTTLVKRPEEQVHFIQYGLVGVLFSRALRGRFGQSVKTDIAAFSIAMIAGWIDEVLQGHLPNRHYDVRDLWLNAVSAFLGLMVYRTIPHAQPKGEPWR